MDGVFSALNDPWPLLLLDASERALGDSKPGVRVLCALLEEISYCLCSRCPMVGVNVEARFLVHNNLHKPGTCEASF